MREHTTDDEVFIEQRGSLGLITLNRPEALNALTHTMVLLITEALERFCDDDRVQHVAVIGAGTRGLCAGGDIVSLYRDATEGDGTASAKFWADEYHLNHLIATYRKPYIAIQDGIVLGGGIGVSAHGSHRIVTETTRMGFPEVTIGFVPDVGASWLLSRAPNELGTRIALTGEHVGAADAIRIGLADTFVPQEQLDALLVHLETRSAAEAIELVSGEAPEGKLGADPAWAQHAFSAPSVEEILERLHTLGDDGVDLAQTIREKSPTSVKVALEMLRRGAALETLADALQMEYRLAIRLFASDDFREGVRAQVIDKDRNPRWNPANLHEVTEDIVDDYFAPLSNDLLIAGAQE